MTRYKLMHLFDNKVVAYNFTSHEGVNEFVKDNMPDVNPDLYGIVEYTKLDGSGENINHPEGDE